MNRSEKSTNKKKWLKTCEWILWKFDVLIWFYPKIIAFSFYFFIQQLGGAEEIP